MAADMACETDGKCYFNKWPSKNGKKRRKKKRNNHILSKLDFIFLEIVVPIISFTFKASNGHKGPVLAVLPSAQAASSGAGSASPSSGA